jgi:hypothetical protein
MTRSRKLLVIFTTGWLTEEAIRREEKHLHEILSSIETPEQFCIAFELVDRNRITSKKEKIIKESRHYHLRPFRFLINKN